MKLILGVRKKSGKSYEIREWGIEGKEKCVLQWWGLHFWMNKCLLIFFIFQWNFKTESRKNRFGCPTTI